MHLEAREWVRDVAELFDLHGEVLELGGRDVNGGVRDLIVHDRWLSVDVRAGDGVDIVADAADVRLDEDFDVVVSTEVLEHTPKGKDIVRTAYLHLRVGGVFVATMAGPGRGAHSADGGHLTGGEYYGNVEPDELRIWLRAAGFTLHEINVSGTDVRCWARR